MPCWAPSRGSSPVHPATVILPSQDSLPRSWNACPNPKTSQGLDDVFMEGDHSQESQEFRIPKDKIPEKTPQEFHPENSYNPGPKAREKDLEGVQSSQACGLNTSTQI